MCYHCKLKKTNSFHKKENAHKQKNPHANTIALNKGSKNSSDFIIISYLFLLPF